MTAHQPQPTPPLSPRPLIIVMALLIVVVGFRLWQSNGQAVLAVIVSLPSWAPAAAGALALVLASAALAGLWRLRRLPSAREILTRAERQARRARHGDRATVTLGVRRGLLGVRRHARVAVRDLLSHGLIVGASGSGKSRLAQSLAAQYCLLGHVIAVIDPHAGLSDGILALVAPTFTARAGLWLGAEEFDHVTILALVRRPGVSLERSARMVADTIETLTEDAGSYNIGWWITFAVWACATAGYTLLETPRLLNDPDFYD